MILYPNHDLSAERSAWFLEQNHNLLPYLAKAPSSTGLYGQNGIKADKCFLWPISAWSVTMWFQD